MNKTTFKFLMVLLTAGFLLMPTTGRSQLAYSEDFETLLPEDQYYFFNADDNSDLIAQHEGTCNGWAMASHLFLINPDSDYFYVTKGTEFLGKSNGTQAILSYSYKIIDLNSYKTVPNSFNWGEFSVSYSTEIDGDYTILETINTTNRVESEDCITRTISFTPPAGDVYLRINSSLGDRVSKSDIMILFDDINVFQSACAGLPVAGATVTSKKSVCTTENIELKLDPLYTNTGLTYQWQASVNGTTFTNIATATASVYTTKQPVTTWYRAAVTCTASGESVFTTPVKVTSTGEICYCDVLFFATATPITLVNFAGINNSSTNERSYSQQSEDFTAIAPAQVLKGKSYPIIIEGVSTSLEGEGFYVNDFYSVFIDFNHNGTLNDDGEAFKIGNIDYKHNHLEGSITIPEGALTGTTFMRVFKAINAYSSTACSTLTVNGVGEAEDYLINIKCIEDIQGNAVQQITEKTKGTATVADIDVTLAEGATVVWFASEAEAKAGALPLSNDALLVSGATYYAVQTSGDCKSEVFAVTVNTVLGTQNFTANNFKYYPNPVTNVLNLSYNKNITGVQVYNLLGQQVLAKNINQNETQLNLSNLAAGTYLVKVSSDDASTSFKVVKQ